MWIADPQKTKPRIAGFCFRLTGPDGLCVITNRRDVCTDLVNRLLNVLGDFSIEPSFRLFNRQLDGFSHYVAWELRVVFDGKRRQGALRWLAVRATSEKPPAPFGSRVYRVFDAGYRGYRRGILRFALYMALARRICRLRRQ